MTRDEEGRWTAEADGAAVLCVHTPDDPDPVRLLADGQTTAHRVDTADEALASLEGQDGPDCVLVAPRLPETDLGQFLDACAAVDPDLPVVVYGVAGAEIGDALDAGATDVVRADAGTDLLRTRVHNAAEQYRTRREARTHDRQLRSLLEHSSDRLSVLDADGRYTFVSPAVERLMGYDPGELLGSSGFEYVHPDDRERVRELFERIRAEPGRTHTDEYRFRHADGSWRWVESRGTNRLDDPAIGGIVINSRDVTERREREDQLREEQALTDAIFAALPDVFYAFDENVDFLRWNDQLSAVTGYSDEEIASMHPAEFVAVEDRQRIFDGISRVVEDGETVTVEARFETKDGELLPYEFTGAPMTDADGDIVGLVGIGRDVSDRKERQRRFEAVFNNTYQFTGLMRPDGTLIEANETALRFGNLDREDVIGKHLEETGWFQTDDETRAVARRAVEQARTGSFYREEVTVQGAEGTEVIDFSVRPITDDRGEVTLLIPEGRTITEFKRRERHLKVLHRFLRHNLRNKMTVIEGTAGVLERADIGEHARHVTQIREAAGDLIDLSETAHELSQIAIDPDAERRPVDLEGMLEEVCAELQAAHPDASITVESSTDYRVSADWRLRRVFEQLVENAVEHAEHDRPTVGVTAGEDEANETVTVRVADDGPGIPEHELAGIVTDEEQTQLTHGTGFGLWLVRSVVDDYSGSLSHESSPEGGSVIAITLQQPAVQERGGTAGSPGTESGGDADRSDEVEST